MSETFAAALRRGGARLSAAGLDGGGRDAERLLRWASGMDGAALAAHREDPAPPEVVACFDEALARREDHAPVSHIVGGREFWGRWFAVTPDVLDPRPETETVIAAALREPEGGAPPEKILDLGVGTGCLLGTMLAERPEATGVGVDASRAALDVARGNLEALGVSGRADLRLGDWLDGMLEGFDLILCNPPYVAEAEIASLSVEVQGHEPLLALTPGGDGLGAYRRIAPELAAYLRRGGRALLEIGPTQAGPAALIFGAFGWADPLVHKDLDGRDRCLEYRRKA